MEDKPSPVSRSRALALIAFLCLALNSYGEATNVSVSAVPDWVRLCDWNLPTNQPQGEKSEASRYLLVERQEAPQRTESFSRVVRLMENQTGVQDCGRLSFGFDPAFQELLVHWVQIHRDGKVLERLDRSKVKIIQPEPDLDGDVFTGELTAVLFVEDLRIGDALEYAYTVRGANPILNGHFAARFVVQRSAPMDRQRVRVVWHSDKPLYLRQHLTELQPRKETRNGTTERVWDFPGLEAIPYEDDLPAGFEIYPYVEVSDFADWSRVVDWALPLYSVGKSNLPLAFQDLLAKWQSGGASNEESARRALDFVQDELRYTGIELGPDSYRPANPIETLRLRFGDCKAKAHLFCTVLREMNIEAYPALVNTWARETVTRRLPSPFAFDHVIVKILLDGKWVWVDPTRSHQGGLLRQRFVTPFGKGLVVKAGVAALEDIPVSGASPLQRVTSTFKLKDYVAPATLTVTTAYHGAGADRMRQSLARTDMKELSKDYLNYYARHYPGISQQHPPEVNDQRTRNVLEVTEHYEIKDLWKQDKTSQLWEAVFHAENLDYMLTDPETRLRKMPLSIAYPSRREQEIVVYLPKDEWDLPPMEKSVDFEAFAFHYHRKSSGSTVRFQYDCETRISAVPAEKVAAYLKNLDDMQALLDDTLYRPDNTLSGILAQVNWLMVAVAGFGMAVSLAGGIWFWVATRGKAAALAGNLPPPLPGEAHLQGLGGWLILVGLGLFVALLWRPTTLIQNRDGFFSVAAWQAVASAGGEHYHPLYGPLLVFEVLGNIMLFALNLLALCLFFGKRRTFPRIYLTLVAANVAVLLLDEVLGSLIPYVAENSHSSSIRQLFRAAVQALIWGAYMLKSRRVKATFVR